MMFLTLSKCTAPLKSGRYLLALLLAGTHLASASYAYAEAEEDSDTPPLLERNLYFGAFGGWNEPSTMGTYIGPRDAVEAQAMRANRKDYWTAGLVLGTELAPHTRADLELSYTRSKGVTYSEQSIGQLRPLNGKSEQTYLLGNIWRDLPVSNAFTPYFGAGLGLAYVNGDFEFDFERVADVRPVKFNEISLAAQVGAGVRIHMSDRWTLDAAYRAKAIFDTPLSGFGSADAPDAVTQFLDHAFHVGVQYDLAGDRVRQTWRDHADFAQDGWRDGWYVGAAGSWIDPNRSAFVSNGQSILLNYEAGRVAASAFAGIDLMDGLRAEVELHRYENRVTSYSEELGVKVDGSGQVKTTMATVNFWKDINLGRNITPYVGGGLGLGRMDADVIYDSVAEGYGVGVAMMAGVGVRMGLSENISFDLGYRMRGLLEAPVKGGIDARGGPATGFHSNGGWSAHAVHAGLVFGPGANPRFSDDDPLWDSIYLGSRKGVVIAPDIPFVLAGDVFTLSNDNGYSIGGVVGVEMPKNFRAELELNYSEYTPNELSSPDSGAFALTGESRFATVLANVWKDFDTGTRFSPYIGGGMGMGRADFMFNLVGSGNGFTDNSITFTAQVGAGMTIDLSDRVALDAGYRYRTYMLNSLIGGTPGTGVEFARSTYDNHTIHAGLNVKIGDHE